MCNQMLVSLSPGQSLEDYIRVIRSVAPLSAEEEHELASRWYNDRDMEAARKLVISHLRHVVRIARGYSGYGLPQADLIQEGNVGLMKAIRRFDPRVGVRLVSFAVYWIKAEIHDFVLKNWCIVKIATTKAQRKLFFNLRSMKKRLGWLNKDELRVIAQDLGIDESTVQEMECRLSYRDSHIDSTQDTEDHEGGDSGCVYHLSYEGGNSRFLPDPSNASSDDTYTNPANQLEKMDQLGDRKDSLNHALDQLNDRNRDIICSRWLRETPTTLQELADRYSISAERVRQLEKNAMAKLQKYLTECTASVA